MTAAPFHYLEREPASALRPWIARYWGFLARDGADVPPVHYVPPDGCTSLGVVCRSPGPVSVFVSGPWLDVLTVPVMPGVRHWGARFLPHAGGVFLGTDPADLRNRSQSAAPFLGSLCDRLANALASVVDPAVAAQQLDVLLLPYARTRPEPESLARAAVHAILATRGECAIGSLATELKVSPRTLLRRFRRATGLTPKQYARIERLRQTAAALISPERPNWARLAAEAGYADQAHLTNEFGDLTGLSPEEFLARVRATRHDNVQP